MKDISVEELPVTPPSKRFFGAPEPPKSASTEPRSPAEEGAAFTLPPGFEIELVASESDGIGKFVAVDWDTQGRLWTMTALEYPVDANESPAVARELYASRAQDKVLVFDRDPASPTGYSLSSREVGIFFSQLFGHAIGFLCLAGPLIGDRGLLQGTRSNGGVVVEERHSHKGPARFVIILALHLDIPGQEARFGIHSPFRL